VPFDEGTGGRMTPRQRRARRRAGVRTAKYTPRADTGADKSTVAAKAAADPSRRVDSAKEKALTGIYAGIEADRGGGNEARKRFAQIQALGLSDVEQKSFQDYTGVASRNKQRQLSKDFYRTMDRTIGGATGLYPGEIKGSLEHPLDKLTQGPRSIERAVDYGVLRESKEHPGSYEPNGVFAGGMAAFPGFGLGKIGGAAGRVLTRKAENAALDVLAKADVPLETLAKRHAKAVKAGETEKAALHQATAEVIQASNARREAGKKLTPFDKRVIAQEGKAGEYVTLYRGMGMDEYSQWAKSGQKIAPGTRFVKQDEDYADAVGDLRKFRVHRDDVTEVSPGVYELTNEVKLTGTGNLTPAVRSQGVTTQGEKALQVMNVPRAIKSSFDISAPFRQGIVLGAADAKLWKESWGPMIKSLTDPEVETAVMKEIHEDPLFELAKDRINFTELHGKLNEVEDNLMGLDYAGKIPVVGKGVEASSRAYNTFLNKLRMDFFRMYVNDAMEKGYDLAGDTDESKYLLDSIADWVNVASGRGGKVDAGKTLAFLNATLFSPRLMISRLKLIDPTWYLGAGRLRKGLHPYVRAQAGKGIGKLASEITATLVLAKMAGADVEIDPRSSDFAKIKLGDTRIDIAGGLAQYITLAARDFPVLGGKTKTSTGEIVPLKGGYASRDRLDVLSDFVENKLAPVPGYVANYGKGESSPGTPFNPIKDTARLVAPIGGENTFDALMQGKPGAAALTATLGSVGFGVDTYPQLTKPKPHTAQGRLDAKTKKELAIETRTAKKHGIATLPDSVRDATILKHKVEARIKALETEQRKAKNAQVPEGERLKLTEKQRYAAVINALRDYVPSFDYESAKGRMDSLTTKGFQAMQESYRAHYYSDLLERWHALS
jgi:hypothetical protein